MIRAAVTTVLAAAMPLLFATAARAQGLDAGGAQPFGQSTWNSGLIRAIILGIPAVITVFMWVVLARRQRS